MQTAMMNSKSQHKHSLVSKACNKVAGFLTKRGRKWVITDRETNEPYLERYYLLFKDRPNWFPFNIVLHKFLKSDDPRCGLHDHPWDFITIILNQGYIEDTPDGSFQRKAGNILHRKAESLHRIKLKDDERDQVWTLFIMFKRRKPWGFINEFGKWEYYKEYLSRQH